MCKCLKLFEENIKILNFVSKNSDELTDMIDESRSIKLFSIKGKETYRDILLEKSQKEEKIKFFLYKKNIKHFFLMFQGVILIYFWNFEFPILMGMQNLNLIFKIIICLVPSLLSLYSLLKLFFDYLDFNTIYNGNQKYFLTGERIYIKEKSKIEKFFLEKHLFINSSVFILHFSLQCLFFLNPNESIFMQFFIEFIIVLITTIILFFISFSSFLFSSIIIQSKKIWMIVVIISVVIIFFTLIVVYSGLLENGIISYFLSKISGIPKLNDFNSTITNYILGALTTNELMNSDKVESTDSKDKRNRIIKLVTALGLVILVFGYHDFLHLVIMVVIIALAFFKLPNYGNMNEKIPNQNISLVYAKSEINARDLLELTRYEKNESAYLEIILRDHNIISIFTKGKKIKYEMNFQKNSHLNKEFKITEVIKGNNKIKIIAKQVN